METSDEIERNDPETILDWMQHLKEFRVTRFVFFIFIFALIMIMGLFSLFDITFGADLPTAISIFFASLLFVYQKENLVKKDVEYRSKVVEREHQERKKKVQADAEERKKERDRLWLKKKLEVHEAAAVEISNIAKECYQIEEQIKNCLCFKRTTGVENGSARSNLNLNKRDVIYNFEKDFSAWQNYKASPDSTAFSLPPTSMPEKYQILALIELLVSNLQKANSYLDNHPYRQSIFIQSKETSYSILKLKQMEHAFTLTHNDESSTVFSTSRMNELKTSLNCHSYDIGNFLCQIYDAGTEVREAYGYDQFVRSRQPDDKKIIYAARLQLEDHKQTNTMLKNKANNKTKHLQVALNKAYANAFLGMKSKSKRQKVFYSYLKYRLSMQINLRPEWEVIRNTLNEVSNSFGKEIYTLIHEIYEEDLRPYSE